MKAKAWTNGFTLINLFQGHGLKIEEEDKLIGKELYPLDEVINILKALDDDVLLQMGKRVPFNSIFPNDIHSFPLALVNLNTAYKMNHLHHDNIGHYGVSKINETSYEVICQTPYPKEFNHGILLGLADKFNVKIHLTERNESSEGGFFLLEILDCN